MMSRRAVLSVVAVLAACGGEKATGPTGRDLEGTWIGTMQLDSNGVAGAPSSGTDTVHIFRPDPSKPDYYAVETVISFTGGQTFRRVPESLDLEPSFFLVTYRYNFEGEVAELRCNVKTSTARTCDGYLYVYNGARGPIRYALHLSR